MDERSDVGIVKGKLAVSYKITFEQLNRISGVKPKTVEHATAVEAWKSVDGLMRSDERNSIVGPHGPMDWQELKRLAERA